MTKNVVVRFRVEDVDLPALLNRLSLIGDFLDTVVIEDFYIPSSFSHFDGFGLSSQASDVRDPKSGWPVND